MESKSEARALREEAEQLRRRADELEERAVREALEACDGAEALAARLLGMPRAALHDLLHRRYPELAQRASKLRLRSDRFTGQARKP